MSLGDHRFFVRETRAGLPAQRCFVRRHSVEVRVHRFFVSDIASVCRLIDSLLGNTALVFRLRHSLLGNSVGLLLGTEPGAVATGSNTQLTRDRLIVDEQCLGRHEHVSRKMKFFPSPPPFRFFFYPSFPGGVIKTPLFFWGGGPFFFFWVGGGGGGGGKKPRRGETVICFAPTGLRINLVICSQGVALRALPWAIVFHAFSVKNPGSMRI